MLTASLAALVAWVLLVLFTTFQISLSMELSWSDALLNGFHFWISWPLLALPAIVIAVRFPLERPRWPLHLAIHAVSAVVFVWLSNRVREVDLPPDRLASWLGVTDPRGPMFRPSPAGPPFARGRPRGQPPRFRGQPFRISFELLLYAGVASACHASTFLRRSRQRERQALELQASLAQANLQALRMQLNPHFLFNTLNAISTLVHTDPKGADQMIGHLSGLLRASLDTANDQEVSLRKELGILEQYLSIERRRFGARLNVELQVQQEALDVCVPTLVLQPLVENAVRHGVESSRSPERILVQAQREGDRLRLSINNRIDQAATGSGAAHGKNVSPSSPAPAGLGIGLSNTKARLQQLYGASASMEIQQTSTDGFTVELHLPWREVRGPGVQAGMKTAP